MKTTFFLVVIVLFFGFIYVPSEIDLCRSDGTGCLIMNNLERMELVSQQGVSFYADWFCGSHNLKGIVIDEKKGIFKCDRDYESSFGYVMNNGYDMMVIEI